MRCGLVGFCALLASCVGEIKTSQSTPTPRRPRIVECGPSNLTSTQVFEALTPQCSGCHGPSAEYKLFASMTNFEAMVVRNPNFITPGDASSSTLLAMLEGKAGARQMPPPEAYALVADRELALPSMGELRCWVAGLDPTLAPVAVSASLSRRMYAEYVQRNLEWALGLKETDFSSGGDDYGLEDPDRLSPRSPRNQYRAQQIGAPHWLEGVPRANELGNTFVQVTVQLSQAWCQKAAAGSSIFYKHAAATDGLTTPASAARVRANLRYLFERVTGDDPDPETVDGLVALFARYEGVGTRTAWVAACSGIVRHPLSLTF